MDPAVTCFIDDGIALPKTVEAVYNDGSKALVPVIWEALPTGLGDFEIKGNAAGNAVTCFLHVTAENFLMNPGFEEEDMSMWQVTNMGGGEVYRAASLADTRSGGYLFHFYNVPGVEFKIEQTVTGLGEGLYDVSLYIHGGDVDTSDMYLYAIADGVEYKQPMAVTKWKDWQHPVIEKIPVTNGEITVGAYVSGAGKGPWGKLDDFLLNLSR